MLQDNKIDPNNDAQREDVVITFLAACTQKAKALSSYANVSVLSKDEQEFVVKLGLLQLTMLKHTRLTEEAIVKLSREELEEPVNILIDMVRLSMNICAVNTDMPISEQTLEDINLRDAATAMMYDMFCCIQ